MSRAESDLTDLTAPRDKTDEARCDTGCDTAALEPNAALTMLEDMKRAGMNIDAPEVVVPRGNSDDLAASAYVIARQIQKNADYQEPDASDVLWLAEAVEKLALAINKTDDARSDKGCDTDAQRA